MEGLRDESSATALAFSSAACSSLPLGWWSAGLVCWCVYFRFFVVAGVLPAAPRGQTSLASATYQRNVTRPGRISPALGLATIAGAVTGRRKTLLGLTLLSLDRFLPQVVSAVVCQADAPTLCELPDGYD